MKKAKKIGFLFIIFFMSLAFLGMDHVYSQKTGEGRFRITGSVKSVKGTPLANVKIIAVRIEEAPFVKSVHEFTFSRKRFDQRRVFTDSRGNFSMMGLVSGDWRVRAFGNTKISLPVDAKINEVNQTPNVELVLNKPAIAILLQAKQYMFKKEWPTTILFIEWFLFHFPNSKEVDNATYWLAYSYNRLSENINDNDSQRLKWKKEAILVLDRIISDYSKSDWVDDAKILRIEISLDCYKLGTSRYIKNIMAAVTDSGKEDMNIQMAGLDAYFEIDQKDAFKKIKQIILKNENPEAREKAILLLSYHPMSESISLLLQVQEEDPDVAIREKASWVINLLKK